MSPAIPRPPGLWRALARDGVLNPEEAAARDAVIDAHHQPVPPEPDPAPPPDDPVSMTPQQRLTPYQALIGSGRGWKLSVDHSETRARLEAFHPDGAAVMVTAVRGRKICTYVLPVAQKKTPRWRAIHPADLEAFLTRRHVHGSWIPNSPCACGKRPYPTEACAKDGIVDVTIRRVVKLRGVQSERRAYRCPDDDRVWHLTHIEKWYGEKKPKHQKEPKR